MYGELNGEKMCFSEREGCLKFGFNLTRGERNLGRSRLGFFFRLVF